MDVFGLHSGASKGTFGDAKYVTEILGGQIRKLEGDKMIKNSPIQASLISKFSRGLYPESRTPLKRRDGEKGEEEGWGKIRGRLRRGCRGDGCPRLH